jgi:hypothetical protein
MLGWEKTASHRLRYGAAHKFWMTTDLIIYPNINDKSSHYT